jgi:hypothetical protein
MFIGLHRSILIRGPCPRSLEPPSMRTFSFPSIVTPHPRHHIHPWIGQNSSLFYIQKEVHRMKVEAPSVDILGTTVPYLTQTKYLTFVWTTNYVMSIINNIITLFRHVIVLCGIDIILWNVPHARLG